MTTIFSTPGAPAPTRRLAGAALAWVAAYGALRIHWRTGHMPDADRLSPVDSDLVLFSGWGAVGLCAVAAAVLAALAAPRSADLGFAARRALLGTAWAVATGFAAAAALLLLDVVGGILPGLGVRFYPLGALSRAACLGAGVLVALTARSYMRSTRSGCAGCGRAATAPGPLERTPPWAFYAAYVAVAGCAVRILAQAAVGFGESPMSAGVSAILFEVGFVLGGSVLPLSLVHSWGRTWPRWTPRRLAGRQVPRRLVLWPAAGISGGLVVYFGLMLLQMFWERLNGRNPFPADGGLQLPETFFWFSVPAYFAWGAGMAVAGYAYARRTRFPCPACDRRAPVPPVPR